VVHTGRRIPEIVHTALLARGWRCPTPSCNRVFRLQRDHAKALALGGVSALWNLRVPCEECHRRKTLDDLARLRAERAARAP
jgi:5-methylcytosine-specific restriction endonuclease McrA